MANSFKSPPGMGPETIYETWKKEIELWKRMTDIKPEKQALAVTLSLCGQARASALEIETEQLNSRQGMNILMEKLDSLFLQDETDLAYDAYTKFESWKKGPAMSMNDYIIEYERLYGACRKHKMEYPDAVLAFKLLDNAGLCEKERQLVLTAASDRKLSSMKSALKRIFGGSAVETDASPISVKQEAFVTKSFTRNKRDRQRGTNPLDRNGKRTKCAICESVFHWAKNCPHKAKQEVKMTENIESETDNEEEAMCNLTFFTKEQKTANEIFMTEAYGCAVIDTACTKTVCGKKWFNNYVSALSDKQKKNMKTKKSVRAFKFGDGVQIRAYMNAKIPAQIGNKQCYIETEVVDVDIPLLLSKESLKKAETVLDMNNDKVTMLQQPINLNFTSTGHYCINIRRGHQESEGDCEILMIDNLTKEEQTKALIKLHKQFGHSSAENLRKLMQNAGIKDTEIYKKMTEIVEKCDVCAKQKKSSPRPSAGLPLADDYNQTVAVDLHEIGKNLWYFHMIDVYSRFSAAAIIKSKESSVIVHNFMKHWIAIHGPPKAILSDNGREFNNGEFQDMCENFNIEVKTTAAYSPWSNGIIERHNQTLTNMLMKIMKDKKDLDWETALCWALAAKNSMVNVHGFSPYQVVFGKNPNFPSVITDKLPALEGTTQSKTVGEHITSLHEARKAFTEAESSERIRRALRKQTRSSYDIYEMGDKVYYKRPDCVEWKGPGTVIGQDHSVIFVRHGGILVRVHQSRIQRVQEETTPRVQEETTPVLEQEMQSQCTTRIEEKKQEETKSCAETISDTESETEAEDMSENKINVDLNKLKPGQMICYEHMDDRKRIHAKIIKRAGKSNGRNRNWFNIQCTEPEEYKGERMSVDLSKVNKLTLLFSKPEIGVDSGENDNVMMIEGVNFDEAKEKELDNWKRNGVYTEVEDNGQKCVSTRWICTLKESKEGVTAKARLVARGFEEIGNESMQKDSPTCTSESLKVILSVFAQRKWTPCSMDIKTAFLQGKEIDRDIYVRPPKEANSRGKLWHLQKCVYGLNDASLQWYRKVKDVLNKLGGTVSKVDPAVFYWMEGNEVEGILACHVDDFIWGGTEHFEKTVIEEIRKVFQVGKEENRAFQYIGLELSADKDTIYLHQSKYGDNLEHISIQKIRTQQKQDEMTADEKQTYRSKVGQILWTARQSRPDVSFDACQLASNIKGGRVEHLVEANKVINRIKSEHVQLKFQNLGSRPLKLIVYTDASLGNLNNGGTQGGYFIFLANEKGDVVPICWNSKRINRVVRSTLAGETLAMAEGIDEAIFVATLFSEITTGKATTDGLPLVCMTDCKSLHDALKSTKQVAEKRLRLEISGIRDLMERGIVQKVIWTETQKQLADCLTKKGASPTVLLKVLQEGKVLM